MSSGDVKKGHQNRSDSFSATILWGMGPRDIEHSELSILALHFLEDCVGQDP